MTDPWQDAPLSTQRLELRRPVDADAAAVIAIVGDWEVARRLARIPHPYAPVDFRFFLEHIVPAEPTWAVVRRDTAQLVGMVGLAPNDDGQSAELGYYLGREAWGRGFATEAAGAVVRIGLERYTRLTSAYQADNPASGRVLDKLSFKFCGHSVRPCRAEVRDKAAIEVERWR